jgi:hypothetical protein
LDDRRKRSAALNLQLFRHSGFALNQPRAPVVQATVEARVVYRGFGASPLTSSATPPRRAPRNRIDHENPKSNIADRQFAPSGEKIRRDRREF